MSYKLLLRFKENNKIVIIGGIHPTFLPEQTLKDTNADFIICGEGENAIVELLNSNFENNIKGVCTKNFISHQKTTPINNLDDLEFPDWDQINPKEYKAPHGRMFKIIRSIKLSQIKFIKQLLFG